MLARLAYAKAKEKGIDLEPLLRAAHLTPEQLANPQTRINAWDQIHFLDLVAQALADPCLGFHLGQVFDLREAGGALGRVSRFSSILNEGVALTYTEAAQIVLTIHFVGVHRHADRHQTEFTMTTLVRLCRTLTGRSIFPSRVSLVHLRDLPCEGSGAYFGQSIEFGTLADEIAFPASYAALPVVSADPYLHDLLTAYAEEALATRPKSRGTFRSKVVNTVVPLLPHGKAHAEEIARRLGIGTRTFARRLSMEGFTFSSLLEHLRRDLANRYLADAELSISQIAWLLGYHEVSGFSHAFKRWTGKTPRETRTSAA
jgi:AraC-like DNA-binding protein